ncbi:MAG: hypothetical protein JSU70_00790 [Phycisphaerales bacterium]|nr:MAG: hypothetical protein JSU70_00790 [Phycisphaerales bacterium]
MKKRILLLVVAPTAISLCAAPALALPPIGPPRALLKAGQWAADTEYSYDEMDLRSCGTCDWAYSWTLSEPGVPDRSGSDSWTDFRRFNIDNLRSHMILGSLAYGLCDNWDVHARLGVADAKATVAGGNFNGGFGVAYGFGMRGTLCETGNVTWGTAVQATWATPGSDTVTISETLTVDVDGVDQQVTAPLSGNMQLKWREVQVVIGPTWNMEALWAYGGLLLHFVNGELDWSGAYSATDEVDGTTTTFSASTRCAHDVRERSDVGGYAGLMWQVMANTNVYVEGQFTGTDWGVSFGGYWATP